MKLLTLLAVLTALAVPGCSTPEAQPSGPEAQSSGTTAPPARSTLPRLDVAAEPTWTVRGVFDAQFRDGTGLAIGHDAFQVIDTETGDVRWRSGTKGPTEFLWDSAIGTPHLVGKGKNLAVVSTYYQDEKAEIGLALYSAEDGRTVWRTNVGVHAELHAADDQVVLVSVTESGTVLDEGDLRMIAYDTRTGDKLWDRTGSWPKTIADDTVLGTTMLEDDSSLTVNLDATATAFDVTTGKPRWDLGSRYEGSETVLAAGDVTLVHATRTTKEDAELVVVSTRTGEHVADLGKSETAHCDTDHETVIACNVGGDSVSVFHVDDRTVSRVPTYDLLEAVTHDRIFLRAAENNHHTVDLSGKPLDEKLPGEPVTITDDYLVVFTDRQDTEIAGHRLG